LSSLLLYILLELQHVSLQRELYVLPGRVKVISSPCTPNVKVSSAKKLVTDFDNSCVVSSDADAEISVVVRKEAARTHTLGV
jgi:hypothetical protein